jgi:hypothetical protein
METLKTIALILANPRKPEKWFTPEWQSKLAPVKEESHIPYLVFFGEVMKILDNADDVIFDSISYNQSSVYGPDYDWILRTINLTISREHRETLSDSWQRTESIADSFNTEGFRPEFYIDWNGRYYPPLALAFGGIPEEQAESIKLAAKSIFQNITCDIKDFSIEEKNNADLRRAELFPY